MSAQRAGAQWLPASSNVVDGVYPRIIAALTESPVASIAVRSFASPGHGHVEAVGEPTPLQKVMPVVVKLPRKVAGVVASGLGSAALALGHSSPIQSALSWVAETFIVSERFLPLKDVDVAKWSYFFSYFGYRDHAAFKKYAAALKPQFAALSPEQVCAVARGFYLAKYNDQEILDLIADHIKTNFAKWETETVVPTAAVLAKLGYKDRELFDAVADCIVYCNSQYATGYFVDLADLADVLNAYATFDFERADLYDAVFTNLDEFWIQQFGDEEIRYSVLTMLKALEKWQFFPKRMVDLLVMHKLKPSAFTPEDVKEIERLAEVASVYMDMHFYEEGYKDLDHRLLHDEAEAKKHPQSWNLYVFRDSLVPKTYSPVSIRALK